MRRCGHRFSKVLSGRQFDSVDAFEENAAVVFVAVHCLVGAKHQLTKVYITIMYIKRQ